jgi:hypothetical protein
VPHKACSLACKIAEDRLRHILRRLHIAVDLAQCCGIDQIKVPAHQLRECLFRPFGRVTPEEITVSYVHLFI